MKNMFDLGNISEIELQRMYGDCDKGEEFFKTNAGQMLIEKLINSREEHVSMLEDCDASQLLKIQTMIRSIDLLGGFIKEYKTDRELIREEIENRKPKF